MSASERDPHVLVSARASEHPKIIDLPSDKARWGWLVMLGKAKLQRPDGRFASLRVLDSVLGEYRRYIDDYLKGGILENVGHLCDECARWLPQIDRRPGEIVVHDWDKNQSRTQRWRRDNGLSSGHENLSGETPGNPSGNVGETLGETPGKQPPAGARASQSQSQSISTSGVGGVGEGPDAAVSLQARTGAFPSEKVILWLNDLAAVHGEGRLAAAIDSMPMFQSSLRDYMTSVRDRLRREDHQANKAELAAEQTKVAEQRTTGVNRSLLRAYHNSGQHADKPEPECPDCHTGGKAA